MTVTELHPHRDMTDAEKRDAARAAARANPDISGAELGRMFGQKAAWGVDQKNVELYGTRRPPRQTPTRDASPARDATATRDEPPVPRHAPEPDVVERPMPPAATPRAASRAVHRVKVAGVMVVAAVAAVISYTHMRHLGIQAGEGWRADILPLSVDGMMVVASMTALDRRRANKRAWGAWCALMLGVAASFAANVAAAQPTLQGRLVAAWPPIALVVALELLLHQEER